jgi:hypothetical protein
MTTKTIILKEEAIPKMNEYIAKVNARAHKIGQAFIEAVEVSREMVPNKPAQCDCTKNPIVTYTCMVTIEIRGETPKINGWDFVARIEHDSTLGNILRVAPGQSLPREFWERDCLCDHCNTKRVRKDTFILRNAAGEYKQIGRQCVRDFIGYDNPADMYWWVGIMDTIESECDGWNGSVREAPLFSVVEVLSTAISTIKLFGYVSTRMVEEGRANVTTASYVRDTYMHYPNGKPQHVVDILNGVADVKEAAERVLAWISGWDDVTKQQSEFNFNVSKMVAADFCRGRDFGLIACLQTMYMKAMDQLSASSVVRSNMHIGEVGKKIETTATIKTVFAMSGFYGVTNLVILEDAAGNCFKWNASNLGDFAKDDVVSLNGIVKAHDEYKGRNQTVITRAKLAILS